MQKGNFEVCKFIKEFTYEEAPQEVKEQVKKCVLDLLGAILGGSQTEVAKLAREFAATFWSGEEASIIPGNETSNSIGATFANAFAANAIDIDDGFRPVKGHPGALVIPAALAVAQWQGKSGKELLEAIIVGYEVGTRAGIIWHDHYPVYHASGAWGSVATAAVTAKLLELEEEQIYHALGMAEYQAPINPMMRCIDAPAMVKDGIGWGSQVGVTSALMARKGMTGVPSLFGYEEYHDLIETLGEEYNILRLYFKPHACCRWAQPAISGALKLMRKHSLNTEDIQKVEVHTFEESARLWTDPPANSEEAQYNTSYPIAAAIYDGEVGPRQVLADKLDNSEILELMDKIELIADSRFDEDFPEVAKSEVKVTDYEGNTYSSGEVQAKGDWDNPLSDEEIKDKFFWLATQLKSKPQAENIFKVISELDNIDDLEELFSLL